MILLSRIMPLDLRVTGVLELGVGIGVEVRVRVRVILGARFLAGVAMNCVATLRALIADRAW
jgi:hypothetical protein